MSREDDAGGGSPAGAGCRMSAVDGHDGISAVVSTTSGGPVTLVLYLAYVV